MPRSSVTLRAAVIATVFAMVLAACGGGGAATTTTAPPSTSSTASETTTTTAGATSTTQSAATSTTEQSTTSTTAAATEPVTVVSADGGLVIELPASAADVEATITVLDRSDWPDPLADELSETAVVYELGPDGATFDEPVTVTRRLDMSEFSQWGPFDVPLMALITTAEDGSYELLSDLSITRFANIVTVSGTTTHFTPLITSDPAGAVRLEPVNPTVVGAPSGWSRLAAGDQTSEYPSLFGGPPLEFDNSRIPVASPNGDIVFNPANVTLDNGLTFDVDVNVGVTQLPLDAPAPNTQLASATATFGIEIGEAIVESISWADVPEDISVQLGLALIATDAEEFEARLEAARKLAEGTGIIIQIIHTPLGPFPSFTRIRLPDVPDLPEGYGVLAANFIGEGDDARVVDVRVMEHGEEGWQVDTGLTQYGPTNTAVIVGDVFYLTEWGEEVKERGEFMPLDAAAEVAAAGPFQVGPAEETFEEILKKGASAINPNF